MKEHYNVRAEIQELSMTELWALDNLGECELHYVNKDGELDRVVLGDECIFAELSNMLTEILAQHPSVEPAQSSDPAVMALPASCWDPYYFYW